MHFKGMKRSEAVALFKEYAWEDSDMVQKEITRYQSVSGQASACMLDSSKSRKCESMCKQRWRKSSI